MIRLNNMVGAYLFNDDRILLMQRSANRKMLPNIWSCVGGHMEASELNDPLVACYREILEETGIIQDDIYDLRLRYIIIRRYKNKINQSYIYFGRTTTETVSETDEGELFWIPEHELLNREHSETFTVMLEHYLSQGNDYEGVYLGAVEFVNGNPQIQWTTLNDI